MIGPDGFSSVPYEGFSDKFSLAQVVGRFFNIADDISQGDQIAELKLKQYIGGLPIQVERKNRDPFKIIPSAKLVFSSNEPPRFRDKSEGVWRKLLIIPCNQVIPEKERDPEYANKHLLNDAEMRGIFKWALSGYMDLYDLGWRFPEPAACLAAKDQHRAESSSAYAFLSECVELSDMGDISPLDIYKEYKSYCEARGIKPGNSVMLGKYIKMKFGDVKERAGKRSDRAYRYKLKMVS
jgi:putative DNA primase/helicase